MKTGHVYITGHPIHGWKKEGWGISMFDHGGKNRVEYFAGSLPTRDYYEEARSYDQTVIRAAIAWLKENTEEEPPEENCWCASYPGQGGVY